MHENMPENEHVKKTEETLRWMTLERSRHMTIQ